MSEFESNFKLIHVKWVSSKSVRSSYCTTSFACKKSFTIILIPFSNLTTIWISGRAIRLLPRQAVQVHEHRQQGLLHSLPGSQVQGGHKVRISRHQLKPHLRTERSENLYS
jgi:hypothetical protein